MQPELLKNIVEAALLAANGPLSLDNLADLFEDAQRPPKALIRDALSELEKDYVDRGMELKHIASGYRIQVRSEYSEWVSRLWDERPAKYSRALLETLSLIAYRQPITRGEIEEVRGVAVSTSIIKTLMERDWVKVVGHREAPGRPALYASTKEFLDYFNLASLRELPELPEIREMVESAAPAKLDLNNPEDEQAPKLPVVDASGEDADSAGIDGANDDGAAEAGTTGALGENDRVDNVDAALASILASLEGKTLEPDFGYPGQANKPNEGELPDGAAASVQGQASGVSDVPSSDTTATANEPNHSTDQASNGDKAVDRYGYEINTDNKTTASDAADSDNNGKD